MVYSNLLGQVRVGARSPIAPTIPAPLDIINASYTTTIATAWGFRKLISSYNGYGATIRRSYDNAELSVSFTSNGDINISAMQSFITEGVNLSLSDAASWASASTVSDASAQSFLSAAGITSPTQSSAINSLVCALKYEGLWTKMKAIYPFVGGNATTHKFNLKDPRDTNDAYRLLFYGGMTHDSRGIIPNGSTSYADTNLVPSSVLTPKNAALGVYLQTNSTYISSVGYDTFSNMTDIGCSGTSATASSASYGRIGINALAGISNAGSTARMQVGISSFMRADGICLTDSRGCTIVKRNSSEFIGAQKSDQLSNLPSQYTWVDGDGDFMSTVAVTLCVHRWRNTNGAVSLNGYSNRVQSFAFISDGLTDLESLKLSRIIEKYQTDLGRNVTPNEFGYDSGRAYVKIWNDQSGNGLDLKMMTQHAQPIIAKNGLLLKENNRPTMEFSGLYSGMIGGLLTNTSTFHVTSYHVVGSVLGPGTYAGNNISGSNYILSIIPAASFTANSQASNYYLPPKTGLGITPNLANFNTDPTVAFTYLKQGWTISPTNVVVGVTQSIINFHNGGGYYAITKDNIEGNTTMGAATPASGYMSIGWLQTNNPYNYYTNMRLAEMIFQKSSISSGYFSSLDGSIYTKSQILKNQADYFNIISIPTVDDADAQKFVTQTRVGTSEANAINTLVKGLKSAGLWNKLVRILPFVGSDSWSQRFNLKDPYWTNRGSLGTATSHTALGFVSNGAGTGLINTWINLHTTFTFNNIHMSAYVDNIVSNGLSMGASSGGQTALSVSSTYKLFRLNGFSGGLSVTNSSPAGYYIGNSLGTSMKIFENGVSIGSMTPTSTSLNSTGHAYVGGAGDSNQSARFKFATFGYGLTDAEAVSLSTLVNTFLVAIGRI